MYMHARMQVTAVLKGKKSWISAQYPVSTAERLNMVAQVRKGINSDRILLYTCDDNKCFAKTLSMTVLVAIFIIMRYFISLIILCKSEKLSELLTAGHQLMDVQRPGTAKTTHTT